MPDLRKLRAAQAAVNQGARGLALYTLRCEASRLGVFIPGVKPLPRKHRQTG